MGLELAQFVQSYKLAFKSLQFCDVDSDARRDLEKVAVWVVNVSAVQDEPAWREALRSGELRFNLGNYSGGLVVENLQVIWGSCGCCLERSN